MPQTVGYIGQELNLSIRQGASFAVRFVAKNPDESIANLSDCQIRGQIRKAPSKADVTASFTCVITNAAAGQYEISLTAAQTAAIKAVNDPLSQANVYAWDLELVNAAGQVVPLHYGAATMFREVTR